MNNELKTQVTEAVKTYPNDQELGAFVRETFSEEKELNEVIYTNPNDFVLGNVIRKMVYG